MDIRQLNPPQDQAGSCVAGLADRNPLLGTWKLKSYVATTDAGEKSMPYGEHPTGFLSYSSEGRMQVIGTSDGRIAPHTAAPTWNHVWTGTDQVRFYELNGNTLTITSRLIHPASGTEAHYAVLWEKVEGPR
jgi:hypothetical protein